MASLINSLIYHVDICKYTTCAENFSFLLDAFSLKQTHFTFWGQMRMLRVKVKKSVPNQMPAKIELGNVYQQLALCKSCFHLKLCSGPLLAIGCQRKRKFLVLFRLRINLAAAAWRQRLECKEQTVASAHSTLESEKYSFPKQKNMVYRIREIHTDNI